MIIGRQKEKEILDRLLKSPQAEFVTIYGRRRVGKTFLIREHYSKNIVFDFTGSMDTSTSIQLYNFYNELNRVNQKDNTGKLPNNWSEAFKLLTDFLYSFKKHKGKIVVFIDELPWLDKPKSGFLQALQYFWNQHGSKMKNLIFITCGSAASWIIQKLLKSKGGLYNRVTQRIELKPFSLSETEAFFAYKNLKFTQYQIIQLYMVTGGIPFYLNFIKNGKSVQQAIDELCFEEGGLLTNEFKPLYQSLFKNADYHIEIIRVLAKHHNGLSRKQLLEKTNIPKGGTFSRVIDHLLDCGFMKALPSIDKKAKDSTFKINDFYSLFYLKFIEGNIVSRKNTWQSLANSANFASWSGYAFEIIWLNHQENIHASLGISGVYTKVNSWRFAGNDEIAGVQVDLVIERNDGIIHLCEAKFTNSEYTLAKEYTGKLRQKRAAFEYITKTKKSVVTTLLTTYPANRNSYYNEEIHSEVSMDALFHKGI
jgi:predicted AAA+ superfamily ATPase